MINAGSVAVFAWGAMIGSWLTSLWLMRKKPSANDMSAGKIYAWLGQATERLVALERIMPGISIHKIMNDRDHGRFVITLARDAVKPVVSAIDDDDL